MARFIGSLVHWFIGSLVHWFIGSLVWFRSPSFVVWLVSDKAYLTLLDKVPTLGKVGSTLGNTWPWR